MKPKNHLEQIIVPVYYYEDENGVIHYDFDQMQSYFEHQMLNLIHS